MHITLTGNLGSGKSTISKIFERDYDYEIYSTGKVIRELAAEMGISVLEMNKLMSEDSKYDHMIDEKSAEISRTRQQDDIFFDSRLAWHFVGKAFRVFLSVSLDTAVARIMGDNRGSVETYASPEDCKAKLNARVAEEEKRYKEIYDIDYFNFQNYNLILDSTVASPEILSKILLDEATAFYKAQEEGKNYTRLIISKERGLADFESKIDISCAELNVLGGREWYTVTVEK